MAAREDRSLNSGARIIFKGEALVKENDYQFILKILET
jgi:hypothetical protein